MLVNFFDILGLVDLYGIVCVLEVLLVIFLL